MRKKQIQQLAAYEKTISSGTVTREHKIRQLEIKRTAQKAKLTRKAVVDFDAKEQKRVEAEAKASKEKAQKKAQKNVNDAFAKWRMLTTDPLKALGATGQIDVGNGNKEDLVQGANPMSILRLFGIKGSNLGQDLSQLFGAAKPGELLPDLERPLDVPYLPDDLAKKAAEKQEKERFKAAKLARKTAPISSGIGFAKVGGAEHMSRVLQAQRGFGAKEKDPAQIAEENIQLQQQQLLVLQDLNKTWKTGGAGLGGIG